MRLDKYLKVSRLIKRRTVAKEVSEASRVLVNGKVSKPSKDLKIGDIIEIEFGTKIVKIRVLRIDNLKPKEDPLSMYEFIEETKK